MSSNSSKILIVGTINYVGGAINIDGASNVNWPLEFQDCFDFNTVIATSDSAYLMVGSGPNGDVQHPTAHVIKINTEGDTLWTRNFNMGNNETRSRVYIHEAHDSNYVMAWSEQNSSQIGIVKLDPYATIIWEGKLDGIFNSATITSVEELSDSSTLITGLNNDQRKTGFIIKLNQYG
ncbi:MAG: hypothetical protein HRT57_12295 [Crocinitomicaceae bacterium]|nr:hypothetical protein [Crocinitomicaceae bacterium]